MKNALKIIENFDFKMDSNQGNIALLYDFLSGKKSFLLGMFENPNLLEHDTFTDMLWAVVHLLDELESRERLDNLPVTDMEHLSGDINRAYKLLIIEWIYYMNHLSIEYPYLFSLASRKSPFVDKNEIVIR